MIAIGLIGICLFTFISVILRILDERGTKIHDYVWSAVAVLVVVSMGLIITGLAIVAWRTLP